MGFGTLSAGGFSAPLSPADAQEHAATPHALFYFRDPAYVDRLPPEAQSSDFIAENPHARTGLRRLKQEIGRSGRSVWKNYRDPQELGERVLDHLTALVEQLFAAAPRVDPLERERCEHEAFAESRASLYIGRPDYMQRLDTHAAGSGPPLAVLGASGAGKSALLANWLQKYRRAHPHDVALVHFVGATPHSADGSAMLRRLVEELNRQLQLGMEVPHGPAALRAAFSTALARAAYQARLVLVLDGLNQLEDRDGALDLLWLPAEVPANLRLVVSTLPGRPLDELQRRGYPMLQVEPLRGEERTLLITQYLKTFGKELSPEQVLRVADADQAANPLYLRVVLEELRLHGDIFTIDQRIEHYLASPTIEILHEKVLQRYEQDYDHDRPLLVRDTMTALWAARAVCARRSCWPISAGLGHPCRRSTGCPCTTRPANR